MQVPEFAIDTESPATDPISVLLIDDDPYQLAHLSGLLRTLRPCWRIAAQLSSVVDMAGVLDSIQPDLCILDVVFPGTTSLAAVRELQNLCPVVYVTGDALFAAEAFDRNAADFVVKPVRAERLDQALIKAEVLLKVETTRLARMPAQPAVPFKSVQFLRGQEQLWKPLSEVRYFQAQRKYTRVVLKDQEGLMRLGLTQVLRHLLPCDFLRIHRGAVVNVSHIESARRDDFGRLSVQMAGRDERLVVSKPYESAFRDGFF